MHVSQIPLWYFPYHPPQHTSTQGNCPFNVPQISCYTNSLTGTFLLSLVPRPHPSAREKGLVTIARFLYVLSSTVLILRKPMRSLVYACHMTCFPPPQAAWPGMRLNKGVVKLMTSREINCSIPLVKCIVHDVTRSPFPMLPSPLVK